MIWGIKAPSVLVMSLGVIYLTLGGCGKEPYATKYKKDYYGNEDAQSAGQGTASGDSSAVNDGSGDAQADQAALALQGKSVYTGSCQGCHQAIVGSSVEGVSQSAIEGMPTHPVLSAQHGIISTLSAEDLEALAVYAKDPSLAP